MMEPGVRVVGRDQVAELLPMVACIDLMAETLAALARGEATVPLRSLMWLPDRTGLLGMMPGHIARSNVMGIKVVSVMPGNHGSSYDAHQGAVLLFETDHGCPLAIVDASAITAIRTAAVSGAATRLLARDDAHTLAILGSGTQAGMHLEAMCAVRDIRHVRLWSRTPDHARRFADREAPRLDIGIETSPTVEAAVDGADLICTTTAAREPILFADPIARGAHINAVGSSVRTARELDAATIAKSRLFVDRRESALAEAGDFLMARAEGAVDDAHIVGEVGEVLAGRIEGRRSAGEITLFKSLGLGIEDVAAAHYVYLRAREQDIGRDVMLGSTAA